MIRLIIQTISFTPEGAFTGKTFRTIDVDIPKLEQFLESGGTYAEVSLTGAEIIKAEVKEYESL